MAIQPELKLLLVKVSKFEYIVLTFNNNEMGIYKQQIFTYKSVCKDKISFKQTNMLGDLLL